MKIYVMIMQATIKWCGRDFLNVSIMINFRYIFGKEKLYDTLGLSLIGLLQCSFATTCKRGFIRLNLIKNYLKNRLKRNVMSVLIQL